MAEVLVVSRTRMRNGVCCGGIDLNNGEFIRLHNERGAKLDFDAPYQICQVYDIDYKTAWNARPRPHTEDKQVMFSSYRRRLTESELVRYVDGHVLVCRGDLDSIFDGFLNHSSSTPYISHPRVPSHSVCFWRPTSPLRKVELFGKIKYRFENCYIPYVGCQDEVNVIPAGTLLRMSLANWWAKDGDSEPRCYLQLSGWYNL